jgi:hypothetical protein
MTRNESGGRTEVELAFVQKIGEAIYNVVV